MKRTLLCIAVFVIISTMSQHAFADAPPVLTLDHGTLQVQTAAGPVMAGLRLRLRFADGSALSGELQSAGEDQASDRAGAYAQSRYPLRINPASQKPEGRAVEAALVMRRYQSGVMVAALDYSGPALAAANGIQLIMRLEGFARGMAIKRLKLYWTAPVFVSDYRLLSSANQLLLWKQMQGDSYHLIAPLAGDGMIGEVGVEEIEFRYEFRVSLSSHAPNDSPRHVPLFAYATGGDPYRLSRDAYSAAFAAGDQYGRLRWEKSYPEVFRSLGWCSWNTYYHAVNQEKVLTSVRSLRDRRIPVGFVLVDDGWLTIKENKLAGFDADTAKFPQGIGGLARRLREQFNIPHVGIWHTFQGYWDGVDKDSEIGRAHQLFSGTDGKALPDPRHGAGQSFYTDWYRHLKQSGIDFVKIDNQASNGKFTDGRLPLFASGGGSQRNLQEAARNFFSDGSGGLNLINCMAMSLENAFNWRWSNLARNSDDYLPDNPQNVKEHVYQNAYNAYWTSLFAYPDWDMFQTHDPHAEFHAVARAISGGPVYFTDEPGKEHAELLRRLAFDDGRLLMLDEPGQVTRDLLLTDAALEPVALKVFGKISRPGVVAGMVATFNVNKRAAQVTGAVSASDVEGFVNRNAAQARPQAVAVYQRRTNRVILIDAQHPGASYRLDAFGFDLFTLVAAARGVAVFGLLDKYLGPAAIVSQTWQGDELVVRLREAGDFGAWLRRAPAAVTLDGRRLAATAYRYTQGLLSLPRATFGMQTGEHELRLRPTVSTR
ncbi:MAG TPA: Sip1-related alpha-galactosidase [Blastocatellia bacterium]|nr:Sip1-related alpha-galactosidase [Blastocatellia bacterium]